MTSALSGALKVAMNFSHMATQLRNDMLRTWEEQGTASKNAFGQLISEIQRSVQRALKIVDDRAVDTAARTEQLSQVNSHLIISQTRC